MITFGNRRGGKPVIVQDGIITELQRIPVETKMFKEEWLQNLIHKNPALLPIDEIDSGFSPLIAIGREISTPAGYIDNNCLSKAKNGKYNKIRHRYVIRRSNERIGQYKIYVLSL